MDPIQLLIGVFVIFAISRAIIQFRATHIGLSQFLFWTATWLGLFAISIFPGTFSVLSRVLGIGRLADFVVYTVLGLSLYLVYRLYIKIQLLQSDITKLTRQIAYQNQRMRKKK
ncbi:MAG: DUF2304 domain-containing protein [Nanoarchaeota archaeon]